MLHLLTQRKRMVGGLYFGPPGWSPAVIEDLPAPAAPATIPIPWPSTPEELLAIVEEIPLPQTSSTLPSLKEQLQNLAARRMRALVLNLLPTQPEFALPAALSHAALPDILHGLDAIQKAIRAKRVIIAMDRHDRRTRRIWKVANRNRRYSLTSLLNRYPQAHPTILMNTLFAKRLPVGQSPVRANRMILDPVTCWALGKYLRSKDPFTHRPVQLFAPTKAHPNPRIVLAEIGEPFPLLAEKLRIPLLRKQVIVNGLLAGEEVDPAHFHIDAATESITVRDRPDPEQPSPCFACGWCLDVCPTSLNPVNLLDLAEHAQLGIESPAIRNLLRSPEARESLHCIACGLCSYVCPTRLPLTQQTLRLRTWVSNAAEGK